MARKDALRLRARHKFTSAAVQTLYSDHVPEGQIWCIEQVAWEIDKATSGGNTRVRLYIAGLGYSHFLEEQEEPIAGVLYTYTDKPYIHEGERIALEIDEAQANTTAQMFITGYREVSKTHAKDGITEVEPPAPE